MVVFLGWPVGWRCVLGFGFADSQQDVLVSHLEVSPKIGDKILFLFFCQSLLM